MELRLLRYFVSVAEHLNFTAAAQELFVAQSAVSKQVAELESNLGVTLFIRNKRSVKLTSSFEFYKQSALALGFKHVAASPLVRSSYKALEGKNLLSQGRENVGGGA